MISVRPPVTDLPAPGLAGRYALGVGPAPKSWELPRRGLDQASVCGTCGTVLLRGQPCPACFPGRAAAR